MTSGPGLVRALLFFGPFLLIVGGVAAVRRASREEGIVLRYSGANPEVARAKPQTEQFLKWLVDSPEGREWGFRTPRRVVIYPFDSNAEFDRHSRRTTGMPERLVHNAGYYIPDREEIVIDLSRTDMSALLPTLQHELVHATLSATFGRGEMARWLDEGLATVLEAWNGALVPPPAELADFRRAARSGGPGRPAIPLDKLLSAGSAEFQSPGNDQYYEAAALWTWFLMNRSPVDFAALVRARGSPEEVRRWAARDRLEEQLGAFLAQE